MKREEKIKLLTERLLEGARVVIAKNPEFKRVTIRRDELQDLITKTLGYTDSHTISNWIRVLVIEGLISEPPKDEMGSRPAPHTAYQINYKFCESKLNV